MSDEELISPKKGCLYWIAWLLGISVGLFFLLLIAARNSWILELPFRLFAGWFFHASRAFSHFSTDFFSFARAAAFPCAAAAIALWGTHRLVLWWRASNGISNDWRFKHTALAGTLIFLGSAAAIALSGVLHEAVWLPQGKIIKSNRRMPLTMAINNARQLGMLLFEHESDHESLPKSLLDLEELAGDSFRLQRLLFVDLGTQGPPEPFIFLKSGTSSNNPHEILMISPQMTEDGSFAVLKADLSVTRQKPEKFVEVIKTGTIADPEKK